MDAVFTTNNLWMMIATILVFIMHLGFASLETGLTQSKNTVNILFKNATILPLGLLTYAFWGFNIMYPGDAFSGGFFGFAGFGLSLPEGANDGATVKPTPTIQTSSSRLCLPPQRLPSYPGQ